MGNTGLFLLALVVSAVCGYLLGSINSAIVLCKTLYRSDPRTMGSGNAGMTNVLRNFGKTAAALTLVGDAAKGILGVWCARWAMMLLAPGVDTMYGAYIGAIFAVLGHMFPLYFGFRGGKGIATSLGVILALQPAVALILLGIFLIILAIGRMVSLGSVIGIMFYPVVTLLWCLFVTHQDAVYATVCAAVIALLVVWMHRENVKRILAGTEYKFGQKKKEAHGDADAKE